MEIFLDHVIPHPIRDIFSSESNIWNKKLLLESEKLYQISAASGVGKTTFLNLIYGSRKDFEGSISLDHRNVHQLSFKDWSNLRKNQVSMVFQGLSLFNNLTVFQNILLKNQLTKQKSPNQIMDWLNILGISNLKDKPAGKISYGQKQRVAIVRALCQPFQLLLLDEPFSHLDKNSAEIALQLILDESNANRASILLTSLSETLISDDFFLLKL
ncbi:MAG: ATP-binding cassette domain-containing protein [Bacteroidales bacterium]|nr:ATP-binding cassette domain-containing protein [Bacteroidales bacterium]